jgi:hypothetical protein
MRYYRAPWSTSLITISTVFTILLLFILLVVFLNSDSQLLPALIPLVILIGAALFTIRGYTITPDAILVHRLLWKTPLPLREIQNIQYNPDAMSSLNIHTFGNGGVYSFSGFYRNDALGHFRAFVTDPHRTIVLRYPSRTVLVSPDTPDEFVREIKALGHAA